MGFPAGHLLQPPVHTTSSCPYLELEQSAAPCKKLIFHSGKASFASFTTEEAQELCSAQLKLPLQMPMDDHTEMRVWFKRDLEGEGCQPQTDLQVLSMICLEEKAEILAYFFLLDRFPFPCCRSHNIYELYLPPKPVWYHSWHWKDNNTASADVADETCVTPASFLEVLQSHWESAL